MKDEDYNPTPHTLTILMVLAVCLAVILSLLASCRTVHDTEHVYTHDTLYVHHSDTVREVKLLAVHDTTRQVEHHYITLNQAGDTIREIHHYHDTERTERGRRRRWWRRKSLGNTASLSMPPCVPLPCCPGIVLRAR